MRRACTRLSEALPQAFLVEALDLLASYLFSRGVELAPVSVGIRDDDDETRLFLRELESRHALASAIRLRDLLPSVERRTSSTSRLLRDESKGVIRGRLDIPRYIARRAGQRFGPRSYPTIVTESSADTPENGVVAASLRGLLRQLARSVLARSDHAEGEATAEAYAWTRGRLRRLPWAAVSRVGPLPRLGREAAQRIRKRQTGNDAAYGDVLGWLAEWLVDISRIGSDVRSHVAQGILAFPVGDFFWHKVFEVWCLREVAASLQRVGCELVEGPHPLHERGSGPIFRLRHDADNVAVWFQRQEPLGRPRWRHETSGAPLTGFPDVVVSADRRAPLVIDAKHRPGRRESQSEEIYKVLGYAENFRDGFGSAQFRAVLMFPGDDPPRRLVRDDSAQLGVLFFTPSGQVRDGAASALDDEFRAWLASPTVALPHVA